MFLFSHDAGAASVIVIHVIVDATTMAVSRTLWMLYSFTVSILDETKLKGNGPLYG
jgi:hypothetical protein